jgi:cytochrome c
MNVIKMLSVATLAWSTAAAAATCDTAAGIRVFKQCSVCHSNVRGRPNGLGPNLNGVVGRPVGKQPGYLYSNAMKTAGGSWTPSRLDAFLTSPRIVVPGTKMAFSGLKHPEDRQALICYLGRP